MLLSNQCNVIFQLKIIWMHSENYTYIPVWSPLNYIICMLSVDLNTLIFNRNIRLFTKLNNTICVWNLIGGSGPNQTSGQEMGARAGRYYSVLVPFPCGGEQTGWIELPRERDTDRVLHNNSQQNTHIICTPSADSPVIELVLTCK